MNIIRTPRAAVVVLAGCLLLALAPAARAGDSTEPLGRAQQLVEGQQATIALMMHPTATLKSVACVRTATESNGDLTLDYTFRFRSWYGTSFWSKLRFHFYANGGLDRCGQTETNAWVRPFTAANLVVRWFKGRVQANGTQSTDQLQRLLAQGDAKTLLEWWLKSAQ